MRGAIDCDMVGGAAQTSAIFSLVSSPRREPSKVDYLLTGLALAAVVFLIWRFTLGRNRD